MPITRAQVEHVALLSRLELSEAEKATFADQLGAVLDYVAKLDELDTQGVEPMVHGVDAPARLRGDKADASLPPQDALRNAPESLDGCFRVPRIIE